MKNRIRYVVLYYQKVKQYWVTREISRALILIRIQNQKRCNLLPLQTKDAAIMR